MASVREDELDRRIYNMLLLIAIFAGPPVIVGNIFQGLHPIAILSPVIETLISELNDIFTAYDHIVERHACERIKTIGDAYLAVCGLPDSNEKHCRNIVSAAIDILRYMEDRNNVNPIKLQIRIGIHTGHVIGSVVGIKKYIYDVFGDTVNTAARLEGLSKPMKINISSDVKERLNEPFSFEDRGLIEVKGKPAMQMFFVDNFAVPVH